MMEPWRELARWVCLVVAMSLVAAGAVMVLHGFLLHCRLRCSQSLAECVTLRAVRLTVAAGAAALLFLTQVDTMPWELVRTMALLVMTAPVLMAWLGPPSEHVDTSQICQIGRGSAYSHYYGYLRLMRGNHEVHERLQNFVCNNPAGLEADVLEQFVSDAVVVLAPSNGMYPDKPLTALPDDRLPGVSKSIGCVPAFQSTVGGNKRSYAEFSVHKVTSSNAQSRNRSVYVALDTVAALGTLRKLREHGPARLNRADCQKQMEEMMDELEKIVASKDHLEGQVKVVRYSPGDHVGDAILAAI